jgi:general L-amino acid transport system permease protein
MKTNQKILLQFGIGTIFFGLIGILINNLTINLIRTGLGFNFT